ncbi:MAG: ABC transporter permease [Thermoplasmata archaeon]|nr:ABC transporter permease [Thermoplasmata archaeon]
MSALVQLVVIVAIVLVAVGLMAMRRRMFARMAIRNVTRRMRYAVIVISGLLVATAMISGSLVVGDTLDYIIKGDVFESSGNADILVTVEDESGASLFFNQSVADDLIHSQESGSAPHIDMVTPAIRRAATIINLKNNLSIPSALIFAYDRQNAIGELIDSDGNDFGAEDTTSEKVVLNAGLAGEIEATIGDQLFVLSKDGMPVYLEVAGVAVEEGMGVWRFSDILFVDLQFAQDTIFGRPGMINAIDISCLGDIEEGYKVSSQAVTELEQNLDSGYDYEISEIKRDGVESAETAADQISQIFIVMSSFAIIAGIALIINIFVMLAEERKPEMGISRAIGMQRGDLTQTFMFEGIVYAIAASIVGAFAGLLIAIVMLEAFSMIFGGAGMSWSLHFQWESLGIAATSGFLLTALTVIVASWRVSKLNIVRAIRDIPEPMLVKSERRYVITGALAILFGSLLTVVSASAEQAAGIVSGPCLIALGAAMIAIRFVGPRVPFSLAGIFMIFWMLDPLNIIDQLFGTLGGDMEMFILSGVLLVTGGVILAMFNSDLLLAGLMRLFGRGKTMLPILKIAISYPLNKKFRTGLTLFIFALIMFTVIVIAMMASFQRESVDTMSEKFSGGFEIIAFSLHDITDEDLLDGMDEVNASLGADVIMRVESARSALVSLHTDSSNLTPTANLIGFNDRMLSDGDFSLASRSENFSSDEDAWNAIAGNSSLAILDGSYSQSMFSFTTGGLSLGVDDTFSVTFSTGMTKNMTVIGIMDQLILGGVFTSAEFVESNAPVYQQSLFYIDTIGGTGFTDDQIRAEIEKTFAEYGLIAIVVKDLIEEFMNMASATMQLMEIFLGVGLIVGITGLGIITIRNIAERRQEIGVMRAIGFQRDMILKTFLLETSFVSLLGITLGILLGLALSWSLFSWGGFDEFSRFVIPWSEILMITIIAFAMTLASTLSPSRRAARLAPAEALRRVD